MTTSGAVATRRGISLIETLVVITCVGVVLGMSALTIQILLRVFSDSQARVSSSFVLERLARQLRADAHSSETARLDGDPGNAPAQRASLKLNPEPGREVTYKVVERAVERDETVSGKRMRHESFMLERGRHARFALGAEAGRAMVSLVVEPGPGIAGSPRPLEVLALLGKHRGSPVLKSGGPGK
jgi:hypothetical protein